jgi:hypothetical protein
LGLFFGGKAELSITVSLSGIIGCVGFSVLEIGFVLHNAGCNRVVNWAVEAGREGEKALK